MKTATLSLLLIAVQLPAQDPGTPAVATADPVARGAFTSTNRPAPGEPGVDLTMLRAGARTTGDDAPLGVERTMPATNYVGPTFQAMGCLLCDQIHHYRVIEGYALIQSNVVPVLVGGRRQQVPVGEPKTNLLGIYTTNYIDHPAVYVRRSMRGPMLHPPLPPDPATIFRENREEFLKRSKQTNAPVPPRRSNTKLYVPPLTE